MRPVAAGNQLVLPFLGMLVEEPQTSRELMRQLGPGSWFEHLSPHSGTIYSLTLTLVKAGWIAYAHEECAKLDRTLTITPAGVEELKRRLTVALVNTSWTSGHQFVTALPYLQLFDRETAVALLNERAASLRARSEEVTVAATSKPRTLTEAAKDDYLESRTQFEIQWIESYRDRIAEISWPPDPHIPDACQSSSPGTDR